MARTYYATTSDAGTGPSGDDWTKQFSLSAPGSASLTAGVRKNSTDTQYIVTVGSEPGATSWDGNYSFVWDNETALADMHLTVSFLRIDSGGSVQETIASDTGEVTLSSVQGYTFTKTSASWTSPSASDLYGVKLDFRNSNSKDNLTFSGGLPGTYSTTPHQTVTTGTKTLTGGLYVKPSGDTVDVPWKSDWWYSDNNVDRYNDQANPFHDPDYDETTSFTSPTTGAFGYGTIDYWEEDHPDSTYTVTVSNSTSDNRTYYFIHDVWISNVAAISQLHFRAIRDDFAIIFLNGSEVARVNVTGTPTHGQDADGAISAGAEGQAYDWYITDSGVLATLVEGVNRIGVAVGSNSATSSDMAFDLELTCSRGVTYSITLTGGVKVKQTALTASTLTGGLRVHNYNAGSSALTGGVRVKQPALTAATLTGGVRVAVTGTKTLTGGAKLRSTGTVALTGGLLLAGFPPRNYFGAETGDLNELGSNSNVSVVTSTSMGGAYHYRVTKTGSGTAYFFCRDFNPPTAYPQNFTLSEAYINAHIKIPSGGSISANSEEIFSARYVTGKSCALRLNSENKLVFYDYNGSVEATGTTVLSEDTVYWIGIRVQIGVSGAYEVQINGTTEFSGTCYQFTTSFKEFVWGAYGNANSESYTLDVDNVVVRTDGFCQEAEVVRMAPDSQGNYTAWTGDYTAIDEVPVSTGDYITTSSDLVKESWGFESCSSAGVDQDILAVKLWTWMGRSGTQSAKLFLRISSTDYTHSSYGGFASWSQGNLLYTKNPATGADWTTTVLDSIEGGVETDSGALAMHCAASSLMVLQTVPSTTEYSTDLAGGLKVRRTALTAATLTGGVKVRRTALTGATLVGGVRVRKSDLTAASLVGGLYVHDYDAGTKTLTGGVRVHDYDAGTVALTGGAKVKQTALTAADLTGGVKLRTVSQTAGVLTGGVRVRQPALTAADLTGGLRVRFPALTASTLTGGLRVYNKNAGTIALTGGLEVVVTGTVTLYLAGGLRLHDYDAGTVNVTGGVLVRQPGLTASTLTGGAKVRQPGLTAASLTGGVRVKQLALTAADLTGGLLARTPTVAAGDLAGGVRVKQTALTAADLSGGLRVYNQNAGTIGLTGGLEVTVTGTVTLYLTGGLRVYNRDVGPVALVGGLLARTPTVAAGELAGGLRVRKPALTASTLTGGVRVRLPGQAALTGGVRVKQLGVTKALTGGLRTLRTALTAATLTGGVRVRETTLTAANLAGGARVRLTYLTALTGGIRARQVGLAQTLAGGLKTLRAQQTAQVMVGGVLVSLATSPVALTGGLRARTTAEVALTGGARVVPTFSISLAGGLLIRAAKTYHRLDLNLTRPSVELETNLVVDGMDLSVNSTMDLDMDI